jgi:tetratricopeptide (TPR) repeat protein
MASSKNDNKGTTGGTATTTTNAYAAPVVTRDPRFLAGRSLVQKGLAAEGAIDIFATLVEEATNKYGESSIETAPTYYEYGNALLRAAGAGVNIDEEEEEEEEPPADARQVAAQAAEARLKQQQPTTTTTTTEEKEDKKPAADDSPKEDDEDDTTTPAAENPTDGNDNDEDADKNDDDGDDDDDEEDDLNLALVMMENSFSILDDYKDDTTSHISEYVEWVQEQLPRVLLGIGDTLSALERHADAADAYSRALEVRQERLGQYKHNNKEDSIMTLEHLQAHRQVCEATVLIAEELLACPADVDVVTTETKGLIVKAAERVEYARGYYDKARDALQETVYLMGNLAAQNVDLGGEKEDVCFIATMVMGVGTTLAALDEDDEGDVGEPVKKKAKM